MKINVLINRKLDLSLVSKTPDQMSANQVLLSMNFLFQLPPLYLSADPCLGIMRIPTHLPFTLDASSIEKTGKVDAEESGDSPLPFLKSEDIVDICKAFDRVDVTVMRVFASIVKGSLVTDLLGISVTGSFLTIEIAMAL